MYNMYNKKALAPHSSTLAWKIPWTEEPGRRQSMGQTESDTTEWLHFHFSLSCIGEGNGNPLQCSCLENPRDGQAWWAAVYGVAQSWTRLKRLSSSSSRSKNLPITYPITVDKILSFTGSLDLHSVKWAWGRKRSFSGWGLTKVVSNILTPWYLGLIISTLDTSNWVN